MDEQKMKLYSRHSPNIDEILLNNSIKNINSWCKIPFNLFTEQLKLHSNVVGKVPVKVIYHIRTLLEVDKFVCFYTIENKSPGLIVSISIIDTFNKKVLGKKKQILYPNNKVPLSLDFIASKGELSIELSVDNIKDATNNFHCGIWIDKVCLFKTNEFLELANKFKSDKGSEVFWGENAMPHFYALVYHALFEEFRSGSFNFLEIGLDAKSMNLGTPKDAPSMRIFRQYFPYAVLYGFDINDFSFFELKNVKLFQGDQSSIDDWNKFLRQFDSPVFKIIIDDGSHLSSHQQISFSKLFPFVEKGGIYIIEDIHWQPYKETLNTFDFLNTFKNTGKLYSPYINENDIGYLEEHIATIEFIRPNKGEMVIIRKKSI